MNAKERASLEKVIVLLEKLQVSIEVRNQKISHIATELDSWCRNKTTHHEWCGCMIATKLRDAIGK